MMMLWLVYHVLREIFRVSLHSHSCSPGERMLIRLSVTEVYKNSPDYSVGEVWKESFSDYFAASWGHQLCHRSLVQLLFLQTIRLLPGYLCSSPFVHCHVQGFHCKQSDFLTNLSFVHHCASRSKLDMKPWMCTITEPSYLFISFFSFSFFYAVKLFSRFHSKSNSKVHNVRVEVMQIL